MFALLLTSFIWAFSFSIIGNFIVGKMNVFDAIFLRFGIALILFLPFTKIEKEKLKSYYNLFLVGAFQIGLMYLFYFSSFKFLKSHEVAVFTVTTPLYVALFSYLFKKDIKTISLLLIILSILGGAIIKFNDVGRMMLTGVVLVQLANLSFAFGQTYLKAKVGAKALSKENFAFFFLGALTFIVPVSWFFDSLISYERVSNIGVEQVSALLFLGVVASGLGYFLWAFGSMRVTYSLLSVMNNLVIPLAVLVDILLWNTPFKPWVLFFGSIAILISIVVEFRRQ